MKRQVALKIIKPGMDSEQVIRRFEAERQALALLDHPNVAHVYDAGTTKFGRPYFAMEYVKGVPITEHCDRQRLTIEERLKLFVKVCEAIQHAHQKGIIHRDIKPSNIQVCFQGEQVVPKVIDFGVAKALSQPLTERTLVTEQGQLIGTPEYISPEQAEMTNQDIDTRSDIYSLGAVLYELLTGTLPFESQTLRKGSLEQIREVIRVAEPRTPSSQVSSLDAEASTRLANSCQSDAATLRRRLRGDLDWITLKAMEKDRMRRYQTAHALAEDIERHLNNEPVSAGRPGTFYRFQKLVRRNRGIFAGVAAVAAALVIGLTISAVSLVREQHARRIAVRAQEKETALRYASDMSLAQHALAMNDLGRARRLLEAHRPAPAEADLRGWEWRYLWQECRSDAIGELCRYPGSPFSVAYSPNGNVLAVAGIMEEFVEIWDVPAHKRITTLQPKEGHLVAFSPRGGLLATDAGNQVRLWRTGPWNLVGQLAVPGRVSVLKFSPDGTRLASLSHPDEVTVWEVDQWAVIRRIHGARRAGWFEGRLDFSPDSKALVIGDADGQLRVVDLTSGNTDVNIPEAHSEGITCVAWSPNGSIIASGSGYSGGPIRLWDAASGQPLGSLEGHNSWICKLIFSTDGLRLYSASADQTIRIWDVGQRGCLATLRGNTDEVYRLALSPDGTTLASASKDGIVAFWSALPGPQEESPRLIPLGRFWPAFAPDSRVLAAPRAGTISLFDLATLREIEQLPAMGTDGVTAVAYSPDGTLLVSGSRSGKIRVWSCAERRLLRELDGHKESILMFRFRADSTRLFSVDAKGNVILWDTLTWQPARTFVGELAGVGDVSPDGRLAAMDAAGAMRWQNAETGELLATTTGGHRRSAWGVVFSGDGSRVASVATDGTVALWDPSSFQLIAAFKGHVNAAQAAAFSPDGRRLAAANSEGKLHLWRAPSWAEIEAEEKKLKHTQSP